MEHQKPTAGKFALNYGIILGVIMLAISVTMYVTGMALEGVQWPVFIYYVLFPIIIIYGISQFKKTNANTLSLGDGLKVGLAIAIISALVYVVWIFVFNYAIDPEFTAQSMEVVREKMLENPNMTEEQVEQSIKWAEMFSSPSAASLGWTAMSLIFGLIYSLIGGLVMKTK
ncbi:DUF4199 domain-containing protein [Winogradskyella sp.]|uniref:DUF4199 domain-containing protein n=1 Tax=Winogradskyella sp. TaxID=1883156 RepID=UPI002637FC89|nr:DUF4199 domain-containing protein [Winogradskyella sp.]